MTTDGPGPGPARWVVPVMVAVIAAVATVLGAVLPTLLSRDRDGPQTPPPGGGPATSGPGGAAGSAPAPTGTAVLVSVDRLVSSLDSTDLDPDDGDGLADLSVADDKLVALSSAQLAPLEPGERPSPARCASLPKDAWVGALGPPALASGRTLCLRTSAGRWGAVAVASVKMVERELAYVQVRVTVWG